MLQNLDWQSIASATLVLFFVLDPFGNTPIFNALLKQEPVPSRVRILIRESVIGLAVLLVFLVSGRQIMNVLGLSDSSLNIAGGALLFVIALQMVFPGRHSGQSSEEHQEEAFIVPIAVPMIAGPSAMALVMLQSSANHLGLLGGVVSLMLAWLANTVVVASSPIFVDKLGPRLLRAVERLMGMLLLILAVQMFLNGLTVYLGGVLNP